MCICGRMPGSPSRLPALAEKDLEAFGEGVNLLQGAGFNVYDLGVDLSSEQVIAQVEKIKPDILGLSALLTTSMPEMKKVIEALKTGKLRDHVKVMVGGAPLNTAFAEKIGADGYGKNATEAVDLARHFMAERANRVAV